MATIPTEPVGGASGPNGDARIDEMETAKQSAKADLSELKTQAQDDLREITETARRDFEDARRAAGHYAEDRKNDAAHQVEEVAAAVHRVAEDLERGESPLIGRYAREIGDGLDRFSRSARSRSLPELVGEVERFGRERPGAFLAGAALLGFAASRFLGASSERRPEGDTSHSFSRHRSAGHPQGDFADHPGVGQTAATLGKQEDA